MLDLVMLHIIIIYLERDILRICFNYNNQNHSETFKLINRRQLDRHKGKFIYLIKKGKESSVKEIYGQSKL